MLVFNKRLWHYIRMATTFTSATCPECNTHFSHLPVEFDGPTGYALLETKPCAECGTMLCECCSVFQCDSCAQTVCSSHKTVVDDLKCCSECAFAIPSQELPAPELVGAAACVGCTRTVTALDSRSSDVFGWWHTSCLNAATEAAGAYMAERDECEGVTFREPAAIPTSRPMGAAVEAVPGEAGSTEAA
jgi:hypothetical protein